METTYILNWIAGLLTLTGLELVLGIDNIILLSIIVEKLPEHLKKKARYIGLSCAVIFRIILLMTINWITKFKSPLFTIFENPISLKDIILILGGLFLIYKSTTEIYNFVEADKEKDHYQKNFGGSFILIILQIIIFDLIFSLDSVLTAVGLAKELSVMVLAVILATFLMIIFSNSIAKFVAGNPTIKMLALSFLTMIGLLIMAEGWGGHFDKAYVYFAMCFSLVIEFLNKRRQKNIQN